MSCSRNKFRAGLVLLALSGAAALGHEVLWTRRLTDLIGASAEANTRVLECFFLGMALGAALVACLSPRLRRPWRLLGFAELGVAVLGVPVMLLPAWAAGIWPALGPDRLVSYQGQVVRWVLSLLVIVPPAFLMGMTLPLVTRAVGENAERSADRGTWCYAASTLGGAIGLALVVGLGLQFVGAVGSMTSMIAINVAVGVACLVGDRRWRQSGSDAGQPPTRSSPPGETRLARLSPYLAFLSGVGIMAFEVLGLGLLNLKLPLAFYTPALVLTCVVLLLGGSAVVVPWAVRRQGGASGLVPCSLAAAGLMVAACPVIFMSLTAGRSGIIMHGEGISRSLLRLAVVTCLSLGPAVLLAGVVFPLLLCRAHPANRGLSGRQMGWLLAVNGAGGIAGAEIALRVLLPVDGVHQALGVVGAGYALLSVGVLLFLRRQTVPRVIVTLALVSGTAWLLGTTLPKLPLFLRGVTFRVVEVRSGIEGSLAVVERTDLGRAMFLDNLYMLGSSRAASDQERQAHLPLLLHPAPKWVGFIGLGTGITAGGALHHQAVESITILELSALVADAAGRHFRAFNGGICDHPKARVHVEDAGPYLAAATGRFDVIIGDLFTPWRPGEARLCSLEQFQAAKAALRPGGLFCQWLPMAQLTEQDFHVIVATFRQVFDQVHFFRNHFKTGSVPLAIVGLKTGRLDWNVADVRCAAERTHGRLRDPLSRHPQGLALLYLGTGEPLLPFQDRLNTLSNLRVELGAGRHVLAGNPSDYFRGDGDRWLAFLRRHVSQTNSNLDLPATLQHLPEVGLLATQWEIAFERGDPSAAALRVNLLAKLPSEILADTAADWSLWAGHDPR